MLHVFLSLISLVLTAQDLSDVCLRQVFDEPLLFISRLDGVISAIELSPGLPLRWELDLGTPLLSTSNNMAIKDDFLLIPSLDGNLYSINPSGSNPWPSIEPYSRMDTLLNQKHDGQQRTRWIGGKMITTRGVLPDTGEPVYTCNMENCERANASSIGNKPILAITEERKTVRLLDLKLGVESWNWSISNIDMQYMGQGAQGSCALDLLPVKLGFDVDNGEITALFEDGTFSRTSLPGPLSQSWVLNNEVLSNINMFYDGTKDNTGMVNIYVGQWDGMLYIQPFYPHKTSFGMALLNSEIFRLGSSSVSKQGRNTISWQHDHSTALAVLPNQPHHLPAVLLHKVWIQSEPVEEPELYTVEDILYLLQNLAGTLMLAVILSYYLYRKLYKKKPKLTSICTGTEGDEGDMLLSPNSPTEKSVFIFDENRPFESRFEQDFEVIRELGQGGFGKVIEARHRISEHNYAIKIIRLPSRDELRRKVEREVAAMAKLEHTNILRYYNSWKESPSREWTRTRKFTHTSSDPFDSETHSRVTKSHGSSSDHGVFSDQSDSGIRKHSSSSCPGDEESDSIVFQDQGTSNWNDDTSDSIVFKDETENSEPPKNRPPEEQSDSIVFRYDTTTGEDRNSPKWDITLSGTTTNTSHHRDHRQALVGDETTVTGETHNSEGSGRECLLYIQMQLCSEGTLKDWLLSHRDRVGNMKIFSQIVEAVDYIHSQNHIHRDLKPSNILFSVDGKVVKVADFGLATVMSDVLPTTATAAPQVTTSDYQSGPSLTHNLGTKLYMAPELESDTKYDYKVDIFALGIILYELMMVFGTGMERIEVLEQLRTKGLVSRFIDEQYPKYRAILGQMTSRDPEDRPTAAEVKAFMQNSDCDQITVS